MKKRFVLTAVLFLAWNFTSIAQEIIELPLTREEGFGPFYAPLGGISTYSKNQVWRKTQLEPLGAPKNWTSVKIGDIETDFYQFVYQNAAAGRIKKKHFEEFKQSFNWNPDTTRYTRQLIKTRVAFVRGTDESGLLKVIIDANNNLDFSDDAIIEPFLYSIHTNWNRDSLPNTAAVSVNYERVLNNQVVQSTTKIFIAYLEEYQLLMSNFPDFYTAELDGRTIAVSGGFTDLSYFNPEIVLWDRTQPEKISGQLLSGKSEYIEVNGKLYKNLGVDLNRQVLILERSDQPQETIYSPQIGFLAIPFKGEDIISKSDIGLSEQRGKFVLVDFWAVWCGPCREEIPNLKKLYESTDRSKFEIISVVAQSSTASLKKLVEKNGIVWPQIESVPANDIEAAYGITGFPTTFLIDPNGVIIAKNLQGAELEKKVKELLGE